MNQRHLFHLVDRSPWPLVSSLGAFFLATGLVFFMHRVELGLFLVLLGMAIILGVMYTWWRDVIREAAYQGHHTYIVQTGISMGFILFVISEVMLFFAFFWAVSHSSLSPAIAGGLKWPPYDLVTLSAIHMPLLNTVILLFSSVTVTAAHNSLLKGDIQSFRVELVFTVFLGLLFESLQIIEYSNAPFNISDGIYGSTFYTLTGLHGMHVFVGALFLLIALIRSYKGNLLVDHHLGFLFAVWYWHFVDGVWIVLFGFIYLWGTW